MANETTKMGLIPVRKVGGQSWTGGQQKYRIASGATTAIFQGDLVTQLTAGTIGRHAASGTVPILGVFNGCSYTDPTSVKQYLVTVILAVFLLVILLLMLSMTQWFNFLFNQTRLSP